MKVAKLRKQNDNKWQKKIGGENKLTPVRHDRDEFISINEDNIDPKRKTDFDKRSFGVAGDHPVGGVDTHHTPYDFNSAKK